MPHAAPAAAIPFIVTLIRPHEHAPGAQTHLPCLHLNTTESPASARSLTRVVAQAALPAVARRRQRRSHAYLD